MITGHTMETSFSEQKLKENSSDELYDDECSILDYNSFLRSDDEEFNKIDDFDDNNDDFFESSQIHRIIHTQPIHLIDKVRLSENRYNNTNVNVQCQENVMVNEFFGQDNQQTAVTSSRSSSLFSTFFPQEEENRTLYSSYDFFESIKEASDDFEEPLVDHKLDSNFIACCNSKSQYVPFSSVPRKLPQKNIDLKLYTDEETRTKLHDSNYVHNGANYRYSIKENLETNHFSEQSDKETLLVRQLNSKLSRYTGYYGADSKDQEYSDKVRFQEISYKFSKTYF